MQRHLLMMSYKADIYHNYNCSQLMNRLSICELSYTMVRYELQYAIMQLSRLQYGGYSFQQLTGMGSM
jgi:hypothetical protein